MELSLKCNTRPSGSKANALRRSGQIPAVLYGHKGAESIDLAVDKKTAELLVRDASLNNTLVDITVADISWSGKALLREVQSHPWKHNLYHLSFFAVGTQDSLILSLPVQVVGEADGVKNKGGSLDLQMNEINIRCAPDNIPDAVEVDVTSLDSGQSLHIKDIVLPAGVEALDDPEQVVVMVSGGRGGDASAAEA
ncbi:MAG TPA: 50S ribosomal protein L25/general stress protein Ctc [Leptolyngbyaceae cyanobacterium M33_DOE_097]|uniref:Large ribosomal subunit protein bL25 n=1 Tax=Oscillatoriales cyanobacterium SpSt-418 TaxID=2282169 RepID=A0A7C3PFU5_9CYAN|nr:50S ribosomal protein L25/general stress protein Ctc [Leptolyngbyaceae cyanobacterium M33_DOE_097]